MESGQTDSLQSRYAARLREQMLRDFIFGDPESERLESEPMGLRPSSRRRPRSRKQVSMADRTGRAETMTKRMGRAETMTNRAGRTGEQD